MVCFYASASQCRIHRCLIPGLGETPGEGNGNPLHSPYLGNPSTEEPGRL